VPNALGFAALLVLQSLQLRRRKRQAQKCVRLLYCPSMNAARFSRNKLWSAATLCLLTLPAYSNSFATGFTLDSAFII
jgi:hypothetical protein